MRAALLRACGEPLELVERPRPEIARPDEVLVRIGGAGVCATDLHAIDGLMAQAGVSPPRVLGHENAGWVQEAGKLVSTVAAGDAVIVYPARSCGLCLPCRRGQDMHCERHEFTGLSVDGGFADYLVVPERSLIKLADGVEPSAIAPHADAGITAYHAVKRIAHLATPGATVVLLGVGGVGHIALQLLRILAASTVIAVDADQRRRALARELGADEVLGDGDRPADAVRELTGGRGADVVLDLVGSDATHAAGLEMLARAGTLSVVGYGGTIAAPSAGLVGSEHALRANLVGSWPDLWELLALHARGALTLRSSTRPLTEINDALDELRAGEVTGRIVLVP